MSDFSDFEFELHKILFEILEVFLYKSVTFSGSRHVILIYAFIHPTHSFSASGEEAATIVTRYVVVANRKKKIRSCSNGMASAPISEVQTSRTSRRPKSG